MKILYRTLFVLFFISSVHAIEVEGDVEGEWTMDDSPVIVIDDITLRRNDELVIQPGVEVFFDRYKFFMVYGRLTAAGNEDDSIRFDWHNANSKWRSVRLIDADEESIITYCVFLHSERTGHYQNPESRGGALYLEETSIEVSHCRFSFNHTTGQGGGAFCLRLCSGHHIQRILPQYNRS